MALRDNLKSEKAKERYDRNFNSVETTFSQKELEEHDKEIRNKAIDEFAENIALDISESIIWDILINTHTYPNGTSDTSDKIVDYVIDAVKKVAEQMKGGA